VVRIIVVPGYSTARDISPIVRAMVDRLDDKTIPTDAEAVFIHGTKLRVKKIRTVSDDGGAGKEVEITVQEEAP
jgi:hypothetical protein